jgi:hypothetical protein
MALMALVAQKIWFRKNAFVFEEKFAHPKINFEEATTACVEFHQCNSQFPIQSLRPVQHGVCTGLVILGNLLLGLGLYWVWVCSS